MIIHAHRGRFSEINICMNTTIDKALHYNFEIICTLKYMYGTSITSSLS